MKQVAGGSLKRNGGVGVLFQNFTLLLSYAIFYKQEALSAFIGLFLSVFSGVLCILGLPAAHCSSSGSTDRLEFISHIFFSFFVEFHFLPFASPYSEKKLRLVKDSLHCVCLFYIFFLPCAI